MVTALSPQIQHPSAAPIDIGRTLTARVRVAEQALERLELAGELLPALDGFVRKEALLSAQIEGADVSLAELLAGEAQGAPPDALRNHFEAFAYARAQLAEPKSTPISMPLLNEVQRRLTRTRARESEGSAAFEKYLRANDALPVLVRAGLLHAQLEAMQPFMEGNGRLARLLVPLLLERGKLQRKPLLYLSAFFKRRRSDYHERLHAVRASGDWQAWLEFFLDGVASTAHEAVGSARDLAARVARDRARVLGHASMSLAALRLFELLPRHPAVSVMSVMKFVETTKPTAGRAIELLAGAGVLVETTGRKRDRAFVYKSYLEVVRAGT